MKPLSKAAGLKRLAAVLSDGYWHKITELKTKTGLSTEQVYDFLGDNNGAQAFVERTRLNYYCIEKFWTPEEPGAGAVCVYSRTCKTCGRQFHTIRHDRRECVFCLFPPVEIKKQRRRRDKRRK